MKRTKADTLIIGAGPAGLSTAMHLFSGGKDFLVVEKEAAVGGLSRTFSFKEGDLEFRTDTGPHRFFSKNKYLYDFIGGLLNEQWIKVNRLTRQYIDGKFYDYPINAKQALSNVGVPRAARMGVDYACAKFQYQILHKPLVNFEDYALANFGRSLAEFNMLNYTEKIWGMASSEIHADWAAQRIKGLSLTTLAKEEIGKLLNLESKNKPKTLIDTFYYPEFGTGTIYETIAKKITQGGKNILLNTRPIEVRISGKKITEVLLVSNGEQLLVECKNLVESVPLTEFVKLLRPRIPGKILNANSKLKHRSQVYLFITLDMDSVMPDQWIYVPDRGNPIGRISEMKNFSKKMVPEGKTSWFIEFFCNEGDPVWMMNAEQLFNYAWPYIQRLGFIDPTKIRKSYMIKKKDVYPIYDLHYEAPLAEIKEYLDKIENLYYIGRPGRFRYNNQDHSLEMGILAARSILEGIRYDIEKVGMEKDYYEAGTVPSSHQD